MILEPLLERPLRRLGIDPTEAGTLALMGALVAVLMDAYTVAKVARDALVLSEFGAAALPFAYVGTALASAGFVALESRLVRHRTRVEAGRIHRTTAIALGIVAALLYRPWPRAAAAFFYLWSGSQAMMLLPHFWVLALEVWDSRRARRIFPLLTGCGLVGGLAGGAYAAATAHWIGRTGLLWSVPALLLVAHVLTGRLDARRSHLEPATAGAAAGSRWAAFRGSSYLRVFAVALALSVIVSTLVDFQFKTYVQEAFPDPHRLASFLGTFYVGLNMLALLFQFGAAGWLLQRLGLVASTGLQPTSVLLFLGWMALGTGWWAIVALRWVQGVTFQTLGKSSAEIYYSAVRADVRRRVKPALDTLVERWSDAAVGVMLIVGLGALHAPMAAVTAATAVLAAVWLVVLLGLDRQFGRAFERSLRAGWLEPGAVPESVRVPAARRALLAALREGEPHQRVLALELAEQAGDPAIGQAVVDCLDHPDAAVRAAAVEAMTALRLRDRGDRVRRFLDDPDPAPRRAAVGYLVVRGARPDAFARSLVEGDDPELRAAALDALFERPGAAPHALRLEWVDERIAAGGPEDLAVAARALGILGGAAAAQRLGPLLEHPDFEVRRAALVSAARRPRREWRDTLARQLLVPGLGNEARLALAALGDAAAPPLEALLDGGRGARAQALAAGALAHMAGPRAVRALVRLARGRDARLRHVGLAALVRARVQAGQPVLPRSLAYRLFLRELREHHVARAPAAELAGHPAPEVRLLAASWRETADRALERALFALACWHEPAPLLGAYERLRAPDLESASLALEYLEHVLPRDLFRPVRRVLEDEAPAPARTGEPAAIQEPPAPDRVAHWIRIAWESEDAWLRACAVRAARCVPGEEARRFPSDDADPLVRAELESWAAATPAPAAPAPRPAPAGVAP